MKVFWQSKATKVQVQYVPYKLKLKKKELHVVNKKLPISFHPIQLLWISLYFFKHSLSFAVLQTFIFIFFKQKPVYLFNVKVKSRSPAIFG